MKNVLVTGINGFVGCAIARRLLENGKRVTGILQERNYKSHPEVLDACSCVTGDIRDYSLVRYAISKYEIDTIFHLAAVAIVRQSTLDPLTTWNSNIIGTANVIEAARQCKVGRIVAASSDKAYGNHDILPYTEEFSLQASPDPYSTSKACSDLIAQSYFLTYGLNISVVRSGNIYGPGDLNGSRIIVGNILRAIQNKNLTVYKGAEQDKREYLYIDDVVEAYLTIANKGKAGEAYNIGGTGWYNPMEVCQKILEVSNSKATIDIVERDFLEIKRQSLNPAKLRQLGWDYKFNLEDGLRAATKWYTQYMRNGNHVISI